MNPPDDRCDVSFAIASYNSLPFLEEAIASALAQEGVSVEVLVVDDHGTDGSMALAEEWSRRDGRVRVLQTPRNGGPGAARNIAIENMRGDWYAVLDSDDLIAPERSRVLIDAAGKTGADMIADDLLVFGEGVEEARHLPADMRAGIGQIDADTYFRSSVMFGKRPNLGFLKPMIRARALETGASRYKPGLRIGEDDELVVRLLLAGMKYVVLPTPLYRYRKHGNSISHRLSLANAEKMLASERELASDLRAAGMDSEAYRTRLRSIERAAAFTRSIMALKDRRPVTALTALLSAPSAALLYSMPLGAAIRRLTGKA